MKKNKKRVIAVLILVFFLFSLGCSKRNVDLPSISETQQNQIVQAEIKKDWEQFFNIPSVINAMKHPDFVKVKTLDSKREQLMVDMFSEIAFLYRVNEKLANGEISTSEVLIQSMNSIFEAMAENLDSKIANEQEYKNVMETTGLVQAIDLNYSLIIKNYPNEKHPFVQANLDYFVEGLKENKKDILEVLRSSEVLQDFQKSYSISLQDSINDLKAAKSDLLQFKEECIAKADEFLAAKRITTFKEASSEKLTKDFLGIGGWFKRRYIDIFHENIDKQVRNQLRKAAQSRLAYPKYYFTPSVSINEVGYTPGFGFYVGGAAYFNGIQQGAIPQEYPILMPTKKVTANLIYENSKWYLQLDYEKMLVHNLYCEEWIKSSILKRDGQKAKIEGYIQLNIFKDKVNYFYGTGYQLTISSIKKVYRNPNGPTLISMSPEDGSTVYNKTEILIEFDQEMDFNTLSNSTFFVKDGANLVPGVVIQISERKAKFYPVYPLAVGKTYVVSITDDVKDSWGKNLKFGVTWIFTTDGNSNLFDEAVFDTAVFSG